MKRNLLVFLLVLVPLVNRAEVISERQAHHAAVRFFQNSPNRSARSTSLRLSLEWDGKSRQTRVANADNPAFYVFNYGENQGFVIISGDDVLNPVLAYSAHGHFKATDMPDALQSWFDHVEEKVSALRRLNAEPTSVVKEQWKTLSWGTPVVKLTTPEWDQEEPYNAYLPGFDGWHAFTGCTMTATAIVMGYHQWPERGVGTLRGYYTNGLEMDVPGVVLGHPYLWDKMPGINNNDFAQKGSLEYQEQEDAVSTLMRDLGVMLKARYDYSGTSADPAALPFKLVRHMNYHEGIMHMKEENFSEEVWQTILREELDEERPIVFAGYKADGSVGHSIVLDGYDELGLFSINWGWSGRFNGFYNLESLYAGQEGPDIIGGGYSDNQEAVIRIQPNRPEAVRQIDKMVFTRKSVGGSTAGMGLHITDVPASFEKGSQFTVSVGAFMNFSSYHIEDNVHLAVTDAKGNVKRILYTSVSKCHLAPGAVTMPFYDERDFISVTLDQEVVAGDRIRLLFSTRDAKLVPVTTYESDIPWEIVLKKDVIVDEAVQVSTTIGQNLKGWAVATFSADVATTPSDASVEAFYAEQKDEHTIVLKKIAREEGKLVIPANTGVVLGSEGERNFTMLPSTLSSMQVPASNLLRPATAQGIEVGKDVNAYILAKQANDVLFCVLDANNRKIAANRSYLELPDGINANSVKMVFEDGATGIDGSVVEDESDVPVFDLSGRKVTNVQKAGIYIKNGKKYIVK